MFTVSLKLRLKQFSFPTLNFTRINQKAILSVLQGLWYCLVLISCDLVSCHCVCALFIQQWPATIAQLFPFMPERIRKRR